MGAGFWIGAVAVLLLGGFMAWSAWFSEPGEPEPEVVSLSRYPYQSADAYELTAADVAALPAAVVAGLEEASSTGRATFDLSHEEQDAMLDVFHYWDFVNDLRKPLVRFEGVAMSYDASVL